MEWWKRIKKIISLDALKNKIESINVNGNITNNALQIYNKFNEYVTNFTQYISKDINPPFCPT